ncbi:MAG: hypothetical protein KDC45_08070 [Bacteroidetes bacterium]|nr:hypothetical protein [Bacteroidota bacterium]
MAKTFTLGLFAGTIVGLLAGALFFRQCAESAPREDIGQRFVSYVNRLEGRSDLVLARKTVEEHIVREIQSGTPLARLMSTLFGSEIGHATVEVTCFVEYTYYVNLNSPKWRFEVDGKTLRVTPPSIEVIKPPGLHTQTIEARIRERSIFVREKKHLKDMKMFLSDSLSVLGDHYRYEVQDSCRTRLREVLLQFSRQLESQIGEIELNDFDGSL